MTDSTEGSNRVLAQDSESTIKAACVRFGLAQRPEQIEVKFEPSSESATIQIDQIQPDAQDKAHDGLVLRITTAYEQGFGHALRSELSNPYVSGSYEEAAWSKGRAEGAKRAGQAADSSLRASFQTDWELRNHPIPMNTRRRDDGRYGDLTIEAEWVEWQARHPAGVVGRSDAFGGVVMWLSEHQPAVGDVLYFAAPLSQKDRSI